MITVTFFLSQGFVTFDSCEAAEKAIDEVCKWHINCTSYTLAHLVPACKETKRCSAFENRMLKLGVTNKTIFNEQTRKLVFFVHEPVRNIHTFCLRTLVSVILSD